MKNIKKLGAGVYFSAQEVVPAALLVWAAFFKTLAVCVSTAVSGVLFLNAFKGQYIPQIFIATAVLMLLLWPALALFKEKNVRVPALLLFAAAFVSLIFCPLFLFFDSPALRAVFMVWKEGFALLAETAFWVAAFRFGIFYGKPKTLFSVLAAQTAAYLAAAAFLRIGAAASPDLMIAASAVFATTAAGALKTLIENDSAPIAEKFAFRKLKTKRSGGDSLQNKLYAFFFILAGLMTFSAGMFEYDFLRSVIARTAYPTKQTIIFADVFAVQAVFSVFYLYMSSKERLSVFSLLYFIPAALLAAAAGGMYAVFGLIVLAKAVMNFSASEGRENALQIVPLAVSLRTGFRATMLRKGAIEPLSLALCGGVLMTCGDQMQASVIAVLALAVLAVLLIVRFIYAHLTLNLLQHNLWRGGRLLLIGKKVRDHLKNMLTHHETEEVLYALRVIEQALSPRFPQYLRQALSHENEDVRLYALTKIDLMHYAALLPDIEKTIDTDASAKVRRKAVEVSCRLGDSDSREKAIDLIGTPDLREGALSGLLSAGHEGVFVAIEKVASLTESLDGDARKLAADVLGQAGNPAFYRPLIALLNDEDPEVCRSALIAAGKMQNPKLLPAVMETFRFPDLREDAIAVLLQYHTAALPEIEKVLLNTDYPVQFRVTLTRVAGKMNAPEAEAFLFKHIRIADRRVRYSIIKTLVLANYRVHGKQANIVRLGLYDEIETATGLLAALDAFDKNAEAELEPALTVMKSALNGEIEYIKERILLLLALMQPIAAVKDFMNRYEAVGLSEGETVKIVDRILSGELRTLCLPLFEQKTVAQKLTLLRPHFYPPVLSVTGHIADILNTPAGEATDWTRSCAVYVAGFIKDITFIDRLTELLSDADPIIRETAVWAIGRILPRDQAACLIAPALSDLSAPVARMARFVSDGTGQITF